MNKTDKKTLEEIIRVDHAGERGAIKIYEGQLLALKTFKKDDELKRKIEDMREHEKEHFEFFDKEIQKRNIKPTKLLPLWDLMGITLGFSTAMLGKKAAMLCTASVEEVIDGHYKDQTYKLREDEEELRGMWTCCAERPAEDDPGWNGCSGIISELDWKEDSKDSPGDDREDKP